MNQGALIFFENNLRISNGISVFPRSYPGKEVLKALSGKGRPLLCPELQQTFSFQIPLIQVQ